MNLYVLRHGIAALREAGYKDDSKRPLTAEGRKKIRQNALGMKALGLSFDLILSSPYIRAQQTAEIVVKIFRTNPIVLTDNLIPGVPIKDLIKEIKAHGPKIQNVLLVGHEPHLSELISFLLIGNTNLPLTLKKGGLVYLKTESLTPTSFTLEWHLAPSQLQQLS